MAKRPLFDYVSAKLLAASDGWFDLYQVRIGNSFGIYRSINDNGPSTALELSVTTGLRESHLEPWLDRQARAGFLERSGCKAGIRYRLADEIRDALLDSFALEALFGDDCEGRACRLASKPIALQTSQIVPVRVAAAA